MAKLNPIETARLRLDPWTLEDEVDFGFIASDPEVRRWRQSDETHGLNEEKFESWLEEIDGLPLGLGRWAIRDEIGNVIGDVALKPYAEDHQQVEIQCSVRSEFCGHGFATEAMSAILRYGTELMGLPEVIALTDLEDSRSIHLARKLGFKPGSVVNHGQRSSRIYAYVVPEPPDPWEPVATESPFP